MAIKVVSATDILKTSSKMLGVPEPSESGLEDVMLAALLRRTAGILCPCSRATLTSAALESLQFLVADEAPLRERITDGIESLISVGDLLELNQVTVDDPATKRTWIFCAPPSFVVRPGGTIFILGIVSDEPTPLPISLHLRVAHDGFTRVLTPFPDENLRTVLRDLGLRELSITVWLKSPKPESATGFRDEMLRRLVEQPPSGAIADLLILDSKRDVRNYKRRWVTPTDQTGYYLARRPQAYGSRMWGLASVKDGAVATFLDFPLRGARWRACDVAWHLKMAIDSARSTPQLYRRRPTSGGVFLDFFSPLPLWAWRRLAVLGRETPRENCLFSYWIPECELAVEEAFLQERLWLTPVKSDKEEAQ
jgi:hypothetical protein